MLHSLVFLVDSRDPMIGFATCYTAAIGAAVSLAAFRRWLSSRVTTPIDSRLTQFKQQILRNNPKPGSCERGPGRAVTVDQLLTFFFFFEDFIQNRNAYYVEPNLIRPLTRQHQLSFAEFVGPSQLVYFVSHFWGTAQRHFVDTIQGHAESTGDENWRSLSYWICLLSNNQWRIAEEVGGGAWKNSSFYKALCSGFCEGTCMVLDENAKPLSRLWCIFEVLQTYRIEHDSSFNNFRGLYFCTDRGVIGDKSKCTFDIAVTLSRRLATLRLEDATASDEDDERMIRDLVEAEGGMGMMNDFVRGNMITTLDRVEALFLEAVGAIKRELSPPAFPDGSRLRL